MRRSLDPGGNHNAGANNRGGGVQDFLRQHSVGFYGHEALLKLVIVVTTMVQKPSVSPSGDSLFWKRHCLLLWCNLLNHQLVYLCLRPSTTSSSSSSFNSASKKFLFNLLQLSSTIRSTTPSVKNVKLNLT